MVSHSISLLMICSALAAGQVASPSAFAAHSGELLESPAVVAQVPHPDFVPLPRMAPELALQVYEQRALLQSEHLAAYSAAMVIRADLPDTAQQGEYDLQSQYAAPHTLRFTALQYTGDGFVKNNVILRVLQTEADHVQNMDAARIAISGANYRFSYVRTSQVSGRAVHTYEVKPRAKRSGLFKGHIHLDVFTGSMVRAEGTLVKVSSFFLKKAEFVQDYADFANLTFPVHLHSEVRARVIGRAVVDIYHHDYRPVLVTAEAARPLVCIPTGHVTKWPTGNSICPKEALIKDEFELGVGNDE
jgi:hypothetical protein